MVRRQIEADLLLLVVIAVFDRQLLRPAVTVGDAANAGDRHDRALHSRKLHIGVAVLILRLAVVGSRLPAKVPEV